MALPCPAACAAVMDSSGEEKGGIFWQRALHNSDGEIGDLAISPPPREDLMKHLPRPSNVQYPSYSLKAKRAARLLVRCVLPHRHSISGSSLVCRRVMCVGYPELL